MTKIILEMAVFHANRSMKTNFARKFVIFHWVKQQKTISSPNVDTINICPGAGGKISCVTWKTIKSNIECLFCLFCWVKFVFWSVENSPKLPLGQSTVIQNYFFNSLHKHSPKMSNKTIFLISVANLIWFPKYVEHALFMIQLTWSVCCTNACLITKCQRLSSEFRTTITFYLKYFWEPKSYIILFPLCTVQAVCNMQ